MQVTSIHGFLWIILVICLFRCGQTESTHVLLHLKLIVILCCCCCPPGLLLLLAAGTITEARSLSGAAKRQPLAAKTAAQQNAPSVLLTFAELTPVLSSTWIPSVKTDHPMVQVPVTGAGTPSTTATMSRIRYTVTYTRRPAYVIQGKLSLSTAAFSSTDGGAGATTYTLQPPTITITQQQGAQQYPQAVPAGSVRCSSLTLQPGGTITCTFTARIFSYLKAPTPGTAQASVKVAGSGFQNNQPPATIQTPPTMFNWPARNAAAAGAGPASLSKPVAAGGAAAVQMLQEAMQSSGGSSSLASTASSSTAAASATVTNFFERGEGYVLPAAVQGQQPANNAVLKDTTTYTYTALIADIPREQCGKALKVGRTAQHATA